MTKTLTKILAPIIIPATLLLNGCGVPYQDTLKPENWTRRQKQFVNNVHEIYGEQVTYKELKNHVRNNLGKYQAKIVNHFLKDYVKKENCQNDISDEALVIIHGAIRKLD